MSREAYRMHKEFRGWNELTRRGEWWGFHLSPLVCQSCWGVEATECPTCGGDGAVYPRIKPPGWPVDEVEAHEPWELGRYPDKYGWQMWETTSEGSPMSPVLDTADELAHWLADNGASAFGGSTATYDQWLSTITAGGAVSAVIVPGQGIVSGVEAGDLRTPDHDVDEPPDEPPEFDNLDVDKVNERIEEVLQAFMEKNGLTGISFAPGD